MGDRLGTLDVVGFVFGLENGSISTHRHTYIEASSWTIFFFLTCKEGAMKTHFLLEIQIERAQRDCKYHSLQMRELVGIKQC